MPYRIIRGGCPYCDLCCMCNIARKAVYGREAIYPFLPSKQFGEIQAGGEIFLEAPQRFLTLDQIIILPKLFLPSRLNKCIELGREPLFIDVDTECSLGGFKVKLPVIVAAMGSTDIANRRGLILSEGTAKAGIIQVIGENVVNMRGYDRRTTNQPCLKERILKYFEHLNEDYGGLVIQQNVEDANYELWNKIYSDKDLDEYIERGLIGFEIKAGQGAKPGLGEEVKVKRNLALKLKHIFFFPDDPEKIEKEWYEIHSVPGTFTKEILSDMIRLAKNNYPRVKIWLKLGPYADLDEIIEVAVKAGIDCITIDGSEGGTGMSPLIAMRELGYPTIVCLKKIFNAKKKGLNTSMIIAGRLFDGGHLVKSMCLGADGIAMARPFIIASEGRYGPKENPIAKLENPAMGIVNFVEAIKTEVQMLASALGKYSLKELSKDDLGALDKRVAEMFNIKYVYE